MLETRYDTYGTKEYPQAPRQSTRIFPTCTGRCPISQDTKHWKIRTQTCWRSPWWAKSLTGNQGHVSLLASSFLITHRLEEDEVCCADGEDNAELGDHRKNIAVGCPGYFKLSFLLWQQFWIYREVSDIVTKSCHTPPVSLLGDYEGTFVKIEKTTLTYDD